MHTISNLQSSSSTCHSFFENKKNQLIVTIIGLVTAVALLVIASLSLSKILPYSIGLSATYLTIGTIFGIVCIRKLILLSKVYQKASDFKSQEDSSDKNEVRTPQSAPQSMHGPEIQQKTQSLGDSIHKNEVKAFQSIPQSIQKQATKLQKHEEHLAILNSMKDKLQKQFEDIKEYISNPANSFKQEIQMVISSDMTAQEKKEQFLLKRARAEKQEKIQGEALSMIAQFHQSINTFWDKMCALRGTSKTEMVQQIDAHLRACEDELMAIHDSKTDDYNRMSKLRFPELNLEKLFV